MSCVAPALPLTVMVSPLIAVTSPPAFGLGTTIAVTVNVRYQPSSVASETSEPSIAVIVIGPLTAPAPPGLPAGPPRAWPGGTARPAPPFGALSAFGPFAFGSAAGSVLAWGAGEAPGAKAGTGSSR